MSRRQGNLGHSPIAELVGLVEGVRLLEERISDCVAQCRKEGYGATEVARILGVHRATVYRLFSWGDRSDRQPSVSTIGRPTSLISDWRWGPRPG